MKFNLLLSSISFIFLITACTSNTEELKASDLIEKCKSLKIGTSYVKLVDIMGEPINKVQFTKDDKEKEIIYFVSPPLASTPTQCIIDKETSLVEEIICGESYKKTKNTGNGG